MGILWLDDICSYSYGDDEMMFLPKPDGTMTCSKNCGFETDDVFEYLDHANIEYAWAVRLSKKYSFDMFEFLMLINEYLVRGEAEEARQHIQSAAVVMINASNNSIDEFFEEHVVQDQLPDMFNEIEKILKENQDGPSEE